MSYIFDWLANFPFTLQVIIVNLMMIGFLLALYIIVRGGLNIRKGLGVFEIGFGLHPKDKKNPHAGCPYSHDAVLKVKEIIELFLVRLEIKYQDCVKEQMMYIEQCLPQLIGKIKSHFLQLLRDKKGKGAMLVGTPAEKAYDLMLKDLSTMIKSKYRFYVRENHFTEKTESEFKLYVGVRVESIIQATTDILDDTYFMLEGITREELYDWNKAIENAIKLDMIEIFSECKRISFEKQKAIQDIDAKVETLFKEFTGEVI